MCGFRDIRSFLTRVIYFFIKTDIVVLTFVFFMLYPVLEVVDAHLDTIAILKSGVIFWVNFRSNMSHFLFSQKSANFDQNVNVFVKLIPF